MSAAADTARAGSARQDAVLVLNSGSSSLKAGLFIPQADANFAGERPLLTAQASGIGQGGGKFSVHDADGHEVSSDRHMLGSQEEALDAVASALREHASEAAPFAVGHRIVHGGPRQRHPTPRTDEGSPLRGGTPHPGAVDSLCAPAPSVLTEVDLAGGKAVPAGRADRLLRYGFPPNDAPGGEKPACSA